MAGGTPDTQVLGLARNGAAMRRRELLPGFTVRRNTCPGIETRRINVPFNREGMYALERVYCIKWQAVGGTTNVKAGGASLLATGDPFFTFPIASLDTNMIASQMRTMHTMHTMQTMTGPAVVAGPGRVRSNSSNSTKATLFVRPARAMTIVRAGDDGTYLIYGF